MNNFSRLFLITCSSLSQALIFVSCGKSSITTSQTTAENSPVVLGEGSENSPLNIRGGVNETRRFQNAVAVSSLQNLVCTGLVISPRHIVRSAMCTGGRTFVEGRKDEVRVKLHPKFNYKAPLLQFDIAVLVTNAPLAPSRTNTSLMDINTLASLLRSRGLNAPAIAVGYGIRDEKAKTVDWGQRRSGSVTMIGLATTTGSKQLDGSEVIAVKPGGSNQIGCYGDAGGPIFSESDNSVAIGILSSFSVSPVPGACGKQDRSYYVSFSNSQVRSWLRGVLKELNYELDANGRVVLGKSR